MKEIKIRMNPYTKRLGTILLTTNLKYLYFFRNYNSSWLADKLLFLP
jgi:hypothetical protein